MWTKITSAVITLLIAYGYYVVEWKWHDRRTTKHKYIRIFLLILLAALFLTTVLEAIKSQRKDIKQEELLTSIQLQLDQEKESHESGRTLLLGRLDTLKSRLTPFLTAASEYFPNTGVDSGLALLAGKISELKPILLNLEEVTREEVHRTVFRPLSHTLHSAVLESLEVLKKEHTSCLNKVTIQWMEGNRDRMLVARELAELLNTAGFNMVELRPVFILGKSNSYAINIDYPESCSTAISQLVSGVLGLFIRSECWGIPTESLGQGEVILTLDGSPLFNDDGSLWLR